MNYRHETGGRPLAVFMAGGPLAGKTTVRERDYADLAVVDADLWKEQHPDYDPRNAGAVHEWSVQQQLRQFYRCLGAPRDFVMDGTASNVEEMMQRMFAATESGFYVVMVFVRAPLDVALERNRTRERCVPEAVVREKHALSEAAFRLLRGYADEVREVDGTT